MGVAAAVRPALTAELAQPPMPARIKAAVATANTLVLRIGILLSMSSSRWRYARCPLYRGDVTSDRFLYRLYLQYPRHSRALICLARKHSQTAQDNGHEVDLPPVPPAAPPHWHETRYRLSADNCGNGGQRAEPASQSTYNVLRHTGAVR
jgi:hypothetical protein